MKRYYLGHWVSDESGFRAPLGTVGCLDFAPVPVQGQPASDRPLGLFVTTAAVLSSDYTLLGEGDCRELATTARMQDAFQSLAGYRPQGEKLVDLLYDMLTDGADPTGDAATKPLMPGMNGWLDLHLGGHSRILSAKFEWGKPCSRGRSHWSKIKTMLRGEFASLMADARGGRLRDAEHHRRVLDFWCEKYGVSDWKEFVPANLQSQVPGRLKHQTTITDDFDRANNTDISTGGPLTWTEVNGDWTIASNRVALGPANLASPYGAARADSDLSSADHYAQATVRFAQAFIRRYGPAARFDASDHTKYHLVMVEAAETTEVAKVVSGTLTLLESNAFTVTGATDYVAQLTINGSTISATIDTVSQHSGLTDTAITGNLRCGLAASHVHSSGALDNFEAADLGGGGAGILYTQLERDVRGMNRGMYTSWNF